ncbi:MAG: hypothetical protein EXR48_03785 [Dehalococcoidia bacterium]|nr:hypothetical protein [Dehalococcoidia bacterium]
MTTVAIGRRLGRYELLELLGSTGLASTFLANDTTAGSQVVVKVLSGYFREEPASVQPFLAEVERVKTLRHPGIVPLLESGRDGEHWWLAYEYVPYSTLAETVEPLTVAQALILLNDVAQALDFVHSQGMLHGNLKPSNVFLAPDGHARIGDLGMSVLAQAAHPLVRSTLNTPHPCFTAPERAQGLGSGPRTDVYALGALAYELLTGTLPFYALGFSAVLAKQMTMEPLPPSVLNAALPGPVDEVVIQALARRPEQRLASGAAFVAALRAAIAPVPPEQRLPKPTDEVLESASSRRGLAGTHQAPSAAPSAATQTDTREIKLCPSCGAENREGDKYCSTCWAPIGKWRGATVEEVRQLRRKMLNALRRRRLLTGTVVVGLLAFLAFWVTWQVTGPTHFLDAPSSNVVSAPGEGEWAMYRHDPLHTGVIVAGPSSFRGEVAWTFKTQEPFLGSPAVVGDRVYVATGDRRVVALDARSGTVLWETPTSGPMDSALAVAGDLLYVGLRDQQVLALRTDTGEIAWRYATGGPVQTSPVVAHGVVYVTSGDGKLYALDAQKGTKRWSYSYGGYLLNSPVVVEEAVISVNGRGVFHVMGAISGRHRLSYDLYSSVSASPAVVGDRVYIGTTEGKVIAFRWRPVEYPFERSFLRFRQWAVRWGILPGPQPLQKGYVWGTSLFLASFVASPVATQDTLYLVSTDGRVFALSIDTGETRWERTVSDAVYASPLLVGDQLYVSSRDSGIYILDAKTGEQVGRITIGVGTTADIVVAGDTLYIPSKDGTLYAVK